MLFQQVLNFSYKISNKHTLTLEPGIEEYSRLNRINNPISIIIFELKILILNQIEILGKNHIKTLHNKKTYIIFPIESVTLSGIFPNKCAEVFVGKHVVVVEVINVENVTNEVKFNCQVTVQTAEGVELLLDHCHTLL